jgi:hypothetical protein
MGIAVYITYIHYYPPIKAPIDAIAVYKPLFILAVYTYSISLTHPWDAFSMKTCSSVCPPDR